MSRISLEGSICLLKGVWVLLMPFRLCPMAVLDIGEKLLCLVMMNSVQMEYHLLKRYERSGRCKGLNVQLHRIAGKGIVLRAIVYSPYKILVVHVHGRQLVIVLALECEE